MEQNLCFKYDTALLRMLTLLSKFLPLDVLFDYIHFIICKENELFNDVARDR